MSFLKMAPCYSQSFQNSVGAEFSEEEIIYRKGEILTNVLKLKNFTSDELEVKLKIFAPNRWKSIYKQKNLIKIPANDSVFLPVRIIPAGKVVGNTKFFINAIVYTDDDNQIGSTSFYVGTEKNVNWILNVEPDNRIYFKNNENSSDFAVSVFNVGNYDQDILLNIKTMKDQVALYDTTGLEIEKPLYNLKLEPGEDTVLHYHAKVEGGERNFKSVSLTHYKPDIETTERNYTVYINSVEPRVQSTTAVKRGQKLSLIKLPNEKKVNLYESGSIPLVINGNIQNVLGKSTFMSLYLNGRKELDNNSFFYYSTSLNYTTNYYNRNFLNNLPWTVGYYHPRYDVQIGQISGGQGILTSGQGISGRFRVTPSNEVGAAYIRSPNFFSNYSRESIGLTHQFTSKTGFRFRTSLTHTNNKYAKTFNDILSLRTSFRVFGSHKIGLFTSLSKITPGPLQNFTVDSTGYLAGINYSNVFFNKKLHFNFGGRYNPINYAQSNTERLSGNSRINYNINSKWQAYITNNYLKAHRVYYQSGLDSTFNYESLNFSNQVYFSNNVYKHGIQPGFFYNVLEEPGIKIHARGINLRFTKYDLSRNILFSTFFNAGYNDPISHKEVPNYFIFQFSSILRIKTFSFNTRYMYGPNSAGAFYKLIEDNYNPQTLRLSAQHQYVFKNTHFVLQSSASYAYNNRFKSNNVGLYPELFYFTSSGWRFSVNANYSLSSNNYTSSGNIYNQNAADLQDNDNSTINQGFTLGVSFRKEIGIPNPFAKNKSQNLKIVTFYDLNGNEKWEEDEPTLENVVITIGDNQLITNKKGTALLKNIPMGKHVFYAFSLEKLDGWFADIPDTLVLDIPGNRYVPFVKGVKIRGDVFIEREKLSADSDKPFDLSNIKITATGKGKTFSTLTNFEGEFEFYVPNGTYTMTLDRKVLTDRFQLLRNDIEINLTKDLESIYTSFQIIERKRRVKVTKFKQD